MGTKAIFSRSLAERRRTRPTRQHKRNTAERERLLELYSRGGLSQRRFCGRHDLPLSTLTYWLRQARLRGTSAAAPTIVELPGGLSGGRWSRS
jgi:transposase-like protein